MVFTFYWKGFHNVLRYIINEYIYEPDVKRNVIMYIFVKNVSQFIEMAKFCLGYDLQHAFIAFYRNLGNFLTFIAFMKEPFIATTEFHDL